MRKPTLHMQMSFAVTAKLNRAFVFAKWIVHLQFFCFLNPKFPLSSCLLSLYSPVCVGPGRKPLCLFSHGAACIFYRKPP